MSGLCPQGFESPRCRIFFVAVACLLFVFVFSQGAKQKDKRGQQESNQRPQDLQSHALPLSYDPETLVAIFALQFHFEQGCTTRRLFLPGALAQSEECVLCKHEVRGSKPRCSTSVFWFCFPLSCFFVPGPSHPTKQILLHARSLFNAKKIPPTVDVSKQKTGVWGN